MYLALLKIQEILYIQRASNMFVNMFSYPLFYIPYMDFSFFISFFILMVNTYLLFFKILIINITWNIKICQENFYSSAPLPKNP